MMTGPVSAFGGGIISTTKTCRRISALAVARYPEATRTMMNARGR
jgi:hypothetical protein